MSNHRARSSKSVDAEVGGWSRGVMPESAARKAIPLATGCLDYFPDALCEVAQVSYEGNKKHNPGQPLHWARGKSSDEADTIIRHLVDRGKIDKDGVRHSTKVAWRALANLQKEIEADEGLPISRGSWEPGREQ